MALSFDANYYMSQRPDVFLAYVKANGATGLSWAQFAERHFNTFGRFEGSNPNVTFNTLDYLKANPDVAAAGVNPFVHYLQFGAKEGRAPSASFPTLASFDSATYLAANKDLGAAGITTPQQAYAHFVIFGQFENRQGTPAVDTGVPGQTFTLTTVTDSFTGTANNDTFNSTDAPSPLGYPAPVWTLGDKLDGGAGVDTLNITTEFAINGIPTGGAVSNIENVNILSRNILALDTTSGFSGLTKLTSQNAGLATVTAAGTTALSLTNDPGADNGAVTVNGGSSVNVVSKNNVSKTISVGETTAATGAVTVSSTGGAANTSQAGAIKVVGGTTISVSQLAGNKGATGNDTKGGEITVTGNASTKEVSVTQTKTATGADATDSAAPVVGYTAGDVKVLDANRASATAAGTIETVSITNAGTVKVDSGALKTLNLGGSITSVNASNLGQLTTPANTSLAVNLNGVKTSGVFEIDSDIKTLNLASSTAASTLAQLTANGATTVNVSGDAALTVTTHALTAATAINVTNTAGATFGTAIGQAVTFTGGAGADSVTLLDGFTKAITMGAGNDTVTIVDANDDGTLTGTGGSVVAGDGIDTIVLTGATAAKVGANATFNSKFSGFEELTVTAGAGGTVNLAGINGVSTVNTSGQEGSLLLLSFASGGTINLTGATGGARGDIQAVITNATVNTADVVNVKLTNSAASAVDFGKVTATGVETINIFTVDAGTGTNTAATTDSATLVATAATKVVVSGNNGLNLTNTGNAAITTFDASGVVGNGADDKAAKLAVTFTSAVTDASKTVSITGGAGNDVLTGSEARDIIVGGAGNDILSGSFGIDTLTGGAGSDTFSIKWGEAGITGQEKITDFDIALGGDKLFLSTSTLIGNITNKDVTSAVNGAVNVTATVKDGIITIGGADAAQVDTIGEMKAIFELLDKDDIADTGAMVLNGHTYVLTDNANGSVTDIIQLVGVSGAASMSTSDAANSIQIEL